MFGYLVGMAVLMAGSLGLFLRARISAHPRNLRAQLSRSVINGVRKAHKYKNLTEARCRSAVSLLEWVVLWYTFHFPVVQFGNKVIQKKDQTPGGPKFYLLIAMHKSFEREVRNH